jgi:hypothetical protein
MLVTTSTMAEPAAAQTAAARVAAVQASGEPIQQIDFSLDVRHDDNVAKTNRQQADARGLTRSDERATLGANLRVARMLGSTTLDFNAFAGYDFYRRNTRLNRERIAISGTAGISAGPCNVYLQPQFQRRQSELYELAVIDAPGADGVRNVETTQVYRGELRCGRANGFQPFVSYERSWGDNGNPRRRISDYRGERIGGGIGYSNPILGYLDVSYEREDLDYPKRAELRPGSLVGYRQEDIRLAFGRSVGRMLTVDGFVAHTKLRPRNSSARAFKGLSWNAAVTLTPSDRFRLQGSYGRTISPSLGVDALYSRDRNIVLDGTYYLSSRTTVSLLASRSHHSYSGASAEFGPLLTNYRLDTLAGRVGFAPNSRLRFSLYGGYDHRTSNNVFYNYSSAFVGLNTTFTLGAQ